MSIIAENIKMVENRELKPIATLYTAYNLSISTGIESTDFFYTEEDAVCYGTCKMGSFKVSKLECFIATHPKTGEYKIIKETVCCSIPKPSQEDEEIPPEIKFWCPEEAGFKIYKNGKWSSEYINELARSHKNGIVANLAIFHAFFQSGVNLLNDSNDMVYVVDGRVFCYSHRLRQDIYKDFLCKNFYRVYVYREKFGIRNVLHFINDISLSPSFYCFLSEAGQVIIIDGPEQMSILNEKDEAYLMTETSKKIKLGLSPSDIKRVYMACFKGGPCIEVKNGRIRLKKLHTPTEQKGNLLPSNRPPLHQRIIKKLK